MRSLRLPPPGQSLNERCDVLEGQADDEVEVIGAPPRERHVTRDGARANQNMWRTPGCIEQRSKGGFLGWSEQDHAGRPGSMNCSRNSFAVSCARGSVEASNSA